jgi:hypothetical protein
VYECVRAQIMGTPSARAAHRAQRSPKPAHGAPPVPKSLLDSLSKWKWSA